MKGICPTAVSCDAAVSFKAMAVPRVLSGQHRAFSRSGEGPREAAEASPAAVPQQHLQHSEFSPSVIRTVLFPSSGLPLPSLKATLVLGDKPTSSRGSAFPS